MYFSGFLQVHYAFGYSGLNYLGHYKTDSEICNVIVSAVESLRSAGVEAKQVSSRS